MDDVAVADGPSFTKTRKVSVRRRFKAKPFSIYLIRSSNREMTNEGGTGRDDAIGEVWGEARMNSGGFKRAGAGAACG